jgi:hypothetical protein
VGWQRHNNDQSGDSFWSVIFAACVNLIDLHISYMKDGHFTLLAPEAGKPLVNASVLIAHAAQAAEENPSMANVMTYIVTVDKERKRYCLADVFHLMTLPDDVESAEGSRGRGLSDEIEETNDDALKNTNLPSRKQPGSLGNLKITLPVRESSDSDDDEDVNDSDRVTEDNQTTESEGGFNTPSLNDIANMIRDTSL